MHVEGLTRENVASHLQKFRLQLKKENRLDEEGNLISALVEAVTAEDAADAASGHSQDEADAAGAVTPGSEQVC